MPQTSRRSIANKRLVCSECKLEIEENEGTIDCDKCNKSFHAVCTKLNKKEFNHLLVHEEEEYVCHICDGNKRNKNNNQSASNQKNNNNASITTELNAMREEMRNQLSAMNETMNFMSKQYDDILKNVAENKKKIEIVQKENKALKAEVEVLKTSVKFLNDQRVQNDCVITGVKSNANQSAVDTVVKLSTDVGVAMQPAAIADAYFLNGKGGSQTVVVKFNSKSEKSKLMAIKPKLKEQEETKNIFVNDYLSRETMSLFKYAKALKSVGFRAVYTSGSRVFAKRGELSKPRLIKNEDDVDKLLREAATFKPNQRRSVHVQNVDEGSDNDYESPS